MKKLVEARGLKVDARGLRVDGRSRTPEPLAEGIERKVRTFTLDGKEFKVPMRGRLRSWTRINSEELLEFAKAYCKEHGINKRKELLLGSKSLSGLYDILKQKELDGQKLIDIVFPRKEFEEMKIGDKTFEIPLDNKRDRNWSAMSPEELLKFAKAYCTENKIKSIGGLNLKLHGLVNVLRTLNLLDNVFPRQSIEEIILDNEKFVIPLDSHENRNWSAMTDDDLVKFARAHRAYLKRHDVEEIRGLTRNYSGLYNVLSAKNLLDRVSVRQEHVRIMLGGEEFELSLDVKGREGNRNWTDMPNTELVRYAKAYCREKGITKPVELEKGPHKDHGLCTILRQRKLIKDVFKRDTFYEVTLDNRLFRIPLNMKGDRNWELVSNDEICAYTKAYCKEKGIVCIGELRNGPNRDTGLCAVLRKRMILYSIFSEIEQRRDAAVLSDLEDALESFGGDGS